ncbi:MAG: periplasmic heavy metal sensor [Acidobacteria bacterium]|nr:periplasmic heavy metal sensor [Acidobacteriota bacterium]
MPLPTSAIILALTLLPVTGSAGQEHKQRQEHKWWQSDRFKAELGLSVAQSQQIEEVFQASLPKLRAAKKDLDGREAELSKLVADGATSETQIVQQIDRVEAARGELSKARTLMLFRMRRALSSEQRAKLDAIHGRWERQQRDRTR